MADAIFNRDPLKIGFRDHEGIDLLAGLLQFNPHDRITLQAALDHAYFQER
jgi:serine/threonine protein kinase